MEFVKLAARDVLLIANGISADGVTPLGKTVSFPRDEKTLAAVAALVTTLYIFIGIDRPHVLDNPALRTALVFKLLAYLSRTGRMQPAKIRECVQEVAMAATILSEHPHLISEPVNFANLIQRYRQFLDRCKRDKEASYRKTVRRPSNAPPRARLCTLAAGQFLLFELIHPWHLVEESLALGHCVGKLLSNYFPRHEHELTCLPYWEYVTSGRCRLFSLADNEGPLCTIHVDLAALEVAQLQGRPREVLETQDHYPVIAEAIGFLKTVFPGLTVARQYATLRLLEYPSAVPIIERAQAQQFGQAVRQHSQRPQ